MRKTKPALMWLLALFMVAVGVSHFLNPEPFMRIVPPPLPARGTVYLSGFFEILGGAGLLLPATRRWAAWGLVALYIAVFPANVYVVLENVGTGGPGTGSPIFSWIRLPFQALFALWAWWYTQPDTEN